MVDYRRIIGLYSDLRFKSNKRVNLFIKNRLELYFLV